MSMIYLLSILGVLMHLLLKFIKARQRADFSAKTFVRKNWDYSLFSLLASLILIWTVFIPLFERFNIPYEFSNILAFIFGWFSGSILKAVLGAGKAILDKRIKNFDI